MRLASPVLDQARLTLARLSRHGYMSRDEWAAIEAAMGLGALPADPLIAAGLRVPVESGDARWPAC